MFRDHREQYERKVGEQVEESKKLAERLGIEVPTTIEQYTACNKTEEPAQEPITYESSDDEKYIVQCDSDCDDADFSDSSDDDAAAEK